jgi:hypothetical protein
MFQRKLRSVRQAMRRSSPLLLSPKLGQNGSASNTASFCLLDRLGLFSSGIPDKIVQIFVNLRPLGEFKPQGVSKRVPVIVPS